VSPPDLGDGVWERPFDAMAPAAAKPRINRRLNPAGLNFISIAPFRYALELV
jgi:hypothetical protein